MWRTWIWLFVAAACHDEASAVVDADDSPDAHLPDPVIGVAGITVYTEDAPPRGMPDPQVTIDSFDDLGDAVESVQTDASGHASVHVTARGSVSLRHGLGRVWTFEHVTPGDEIAAGSPKTCGELGAPITYGATVNVDVVTRWSLDYPADPDAARLDQVYVPGGVGISQNTSPFTLSIGDCVAPEIGVYAAALNWGGPVGYWAGVVDTSASTATLAAHRFDELTVELDNVPPGAVDGSASSLLAGTTIRGATTTLGTVAGHVELGLEYAHPTDATRTVQVALHDANPLHRETIFLDVDPAAEVVAADLATMLLPHLATAADVGGLTWTVDGTTPFDGARLTTVYAHTNEGGYTVADVTWTIVAPSPGPVTLPYPSLVPAGDTIGSTGILVEDSRFAGYDEFLTGRLDSAVPMRRVESGVSP